MGTKDNPGEFDCYANAANDEPMFVLLARDVLAPAVIRAWVAAHRYEGHGYMHPVITKEQEALDCADAMETWRADRAD